jgi:hypothetical protein
LAKDFSGLIELILVESYEKNNTIHNILFPAIENIIP